MRYEGGYDPPCLSLMERKRRLRKIQDRRKEGVLRRNGGIDLLCSETN